MSRLGVASQTWAMLTGRFSVQMLLAAVVAAFLTTFALVRLDVFPSYLPPQSMARSVGPEDVVVPFDSLMKGPLTIDQDDPRLIQRIKTQYIYPPSDLPYMLANKAKDDPSMGQSRKIREILGEKTDGFFIECGALDGETRSNTLVFEKRYGWKGVLIEGDPKNFNLMKEKHRKAWSVNACLSTHPYPNTVMFKQSFNIGKISSLETGHEHRGFAEVQCLPLYSLLLALNTTKVDYFSLDVEGAELDVLRTIPWEKVDITTLSVEFIHDKEGKDAIKWYMEGNGYKVYSEVTHPGSLANDFIFVKKDFQINNVQS
ncbi:protein Star-like isoform X3 [Penaeus chinensis]|uniref:protein Star-like isoform X3 n=1 Tax=Penaeus chinensis TaxID=139456 RepID=UPI001FB5F45D|nr:protein Star-like isoform X3 [Penaeus chinensis]